MCLLLFIVHLCTNITAPIWELKSEDCNDLVTVLNTVRGRNNSKFSGSQQDYLVGKCGSPYIYLVVIWPRCKQNGMKNKKFEKYSQIVW